MKKVSIMLFVMLCAVAMNASQKGKRVLVRRSARSAFANVSQRRAPAKELVALYQEDSILHVNVQVGLLVTVTVKDEDGNVLSQEFVTEQEEDMAIPMGGAIVEVSYNGVDLVGMLY